MTIDKYEYTNNEIHTHTLTMNIVQHYNIQPHLFQKELGLQKEHSHGGRVLN